MRAPPGARAGARARSCRCACHHRRHEDVDPVGLHHHLRRHAHDLALDERPSHRELERRQVRERAARESGPTSDPGGPPVGDVEHEGVRVAGAQPVAPPRATISPTSSRRAQQQELVRGDAARARAAGHDQPVERAGARRARARRRGTSRPRASPQLSHGASPLPGRRTASARPARRRRRPRAPSGKTPSTARSQPEPDRRPDGLGAGARGDATDDRARRRSSGAPRRGSPSIRSADAARRSSGSSAMRSSDGLPTNDGLSIATAQPSPSFAGWSSGSVSCAEVDVALLQAEHVEGVEPERPDVRRRVPPRSSASHSSTPRDRGMVQLEGELADEADRGSRGTARRRR